MFSLVLSLSVFQAALHPPTPEIVAVEAHQTSLSSAPCPPAPPCPAPDAPAAAAAAVVFCCHSISFPLPSPPLSNSTSILTRIIPRAYDTRGQEKPAAGRNPGGGGEGAEEEDGSCCRRAAGDMTSPPPAPPPQPPPRGPRTRTKHFVGALEAGPSGSPACSSRMVTRRSREREGACAFSPTLSPSSPLLFSFCCSLAAAAAEQGTATSNASIGLRIEGPKRISTVAFSEAEAAAAAAESEEKKKGEQARSAAAVAPNASTRDRALARPRRTKWSRR